MHGFRDGLGLLLGIVGLSGSVAVQAPAAVALADHPSGGLPGPEILYWDPPRAPQLENTGVWEADPILVSGTSAYREGEFLYQDFLYDDTGTYPNEPERYARNAADFVEVRLKPMPRATAVRLTYNSLLDPEIVATTIALGDSPEPMEMPHGARARMPAEVFVTVHGTTATAVDALTGASLGEPGVRVDLERRQVEVVIPRDVFALRARSVRVGAATGVWDPEVGSYVKGGDGAAFYNVAFRYNQPLEHFVTAAQDAALATGDLSDFHAEIDLQKLRARVTDDSGVPTSGLMNRIKASHFETVQGRGNSAGNILPGGYACDDRPDGCTYQFSGQLQPYRLYVPEGPPPPAGWGLVVDMHGASGNHNYTSGGPASVAATVLDSLSRAWDGAIVMAPLGRGEAFFYWGQSGADVWENIAEVQRRHPIDPTRRIATGASMGGCGTYKFATQFPDFFSGIYPIIACTAAEAPWLGPPTPALGGTETESSRMLASLRHVPQMALSAIGDPFIPVTQRYGTTAELERLGYRFDDWYYCRGVCGHSEYRHIEPEKFVSWTQQLPPTPVDPPRVTYVANTAMHEARYGLTSDHAYWLSDVQVRDTSEVFGTVDVFSHGFGMGDPDALLTESEAGMASRSSPYIRHTKEWGATPTTPTANRLDITATNIAAVTIDPVRARVDCDATINVDSDGPLEVALLGCP